MNALLRFSLLVVAVVTLLVTGQAFGQCTVANQTPSNGQTDVPPGLTFEWTYSGAPDPDHFDIRWQPINPPGPSQVNTVPGSGRQFNPPPLAGGTEFLWWVEALDGSNQIVCSSGPGTTFTTEAGGGACPQSAPILLSPAAGATDVPNPVLFQWQPVPDASEYLLLVREAGQSVWNPHGPITSTSAEIMLSGTSSNWEWYVEARNPQNFCPPAPQPGSENPISFSTGGNPPGNCPEPPVLISPLPDEVAGSPVHFEWSPAAGATSYRLVVSDSFGSVFEGDFTGTSTDLELPPGSFSWFVNAVADSCPPASSPPGAFTVQTGCSSQGASLLNPPDGATSPPFVFFEWSEVPGADGYELFMSRDGGPFEGSGVSRMPGIGLSLPPGLVRWRVDALFPGCPPVASLETFDLTIEQEVTSCDEGITTLILPSPGATVPSPVTFEWTPVPGANLYVVWTSFAGQPFAPAGETTGATTLTASLPSGAVEWFVETHLPGCPPRHSLPSPFTVAGAANCDGLTGPQLLTPAAGEPAVASPVTFSWSPVSGAVGYRLVASINFEPPGEIGFTDGTSLSRPLPEGHVEWWVEAIVEGCEPVMSEHATFASVGEGGCPALGPDLTSPASGSVATSLVRFQWADGEPDTLYRVWLTSADRPQETRVLAETFQAELETFLPPGSYAWWVEAIRPGCPPAISIPVSFSVSEGTSCDGTVPVNTLPADQATGVESPVSFSWTPVSGAVAYEVWLREEIGVEHPIAVTDESSFEAHLPPGRWSWFVQALVEGCDPSRSDVTSFEIGLSTGCDTPPPFLAHPPTGDDVVMSPRVMFEWTPSPGATSYEVYVSVDRSEPTLFTTTSKTFHEARVPEGELRWHVVALRTGCPPVRSGDGRFRVKGQPASCEPPPRPRAGAVPRATSGVEYLVSWEAVPFGASYEIQESTSETFATVTTRSSTRRTAKYTNTVTAAAAYYYRVRAIPECNAQASLFSNVVRVVVEPATKTLDVQLESVERIGNTGRVVQTVFVAGGVTAQTFTASATQSWMTVSPTSGTLPPEGTNLTVTVDLSKLPPGASTGQIVISTGATGRSTFDGTSSVPVTVSLVAPVTSATKSSVKPESIIIPAVGHAAGSNSQWQSDIRITNITSQSQNYQLYFTPSGTTGTGTVKKASVTIAPGKTIAFNDILKSWYGIGAAGENATGSLEVRPETQSSTSATSLATTVASSRTYNLSTGGTFGQFIPGVTFSSFVGKGTRLSLQQIAQSNEYRTNVGVVEGSGEAAAIRFTAFDSSGTQLDQWTESLLAGEHRQYDRILAQRGITSDNARVEVEVTSDKGKITAYASKVDNLTGDPELITPAVVANVSTKKIVLAGVGDFDNGLASWRTDLRIYNGGTASVPATLTYYAQGDPGNPSTKQVDVQGGEVLEMNDLLRSHLGLSNLNGALHVTTSSAAPIVATARTYNKTSSGTYGQFIPGVDASLGVGKGGRALQLLQVEQSPQFRANLGLVEMSGNDVTVEITAIVPGALAAPSKRYTLRANEFVQISPILPDLGVTEAYNARLTLRVVDGSGTINAYASVVDMSTQDPTYVPAQ